VKCCSAHTETCGIEDVCCHDCLWLVNYYRQRDEVPTPHIYNNDPGALKPFGLAHLSDHHVALLLFANQEHAAESKRINSMPFYSARQTFGPFSHEGRHIVAVDFGTTLKLQRASSRAA